MSELKIIGPFSEILTMKDLPSKGPLKDEQLEVIENGAVLVKDNILLEVGKFSDIRIKHNSIHIEQIEGPQVLLPGLVDCHTHICFGGSRERDYAARNNGISYQEIAKKGGGIWDTVTQTRKASEEELAESLLTRLDMLLRNGVTTAEVKSGYGLDLGSELKMLRVIKSISPNHQVDMVPTCLAAHIVPREFDNQDDYLNFVIEELEPIIRKENLSSRFDIFIEENAFDENSALDYLRNLKSNGYGVTVHADQFSVGGSRVGVEVGALSVDHLESSTEKEIEFIAGSNTTAVALPGASFGLGMNFAPGRKLLDAGCSLAIASDWNPGSAPHGYLLGQAAVFGASEKLSAAETFAGMTVRAVYALGMNDRGSLEKGKIADFVSFQCSDYREILYHQGELRPWQIWKKGSRIP